jgi:hypothetical protein
LIANYLHRFVAPKFLPWELKHPNICTIHRYPVFPYWAATHPKIYLDNAAQTCDTFFAFVALVKPLDSLKGLQVHTCSPFFLRWRRWEGTK